jgi:hypothetical protein
MRLGHSVDEPAEKVEPAAVPPGEDTDYDEDDDMDGGGGPMPGWALPPHFGGLGGPPAQDSDDEMVRAGHQATVALCRASQRLKDERPRQLIRIYPCVSVYIAG